MILVALGANLPGPAGDPLDSLKAARGLLEARGMHVVAASKLYRTGPVPPSGQPDFLNGVVAVRTKMAPEALMAALLEIEAALGRTRRERWEARAIDLDLLDYDGRLAAGPTLDLPHPRLAQRRFVLAPLADVAPHWRHPVTGESVEALLVALGDSQPCAVERETWD